VTAPAPGRTYANTLKWAFVMNWGQRGVLTLVTLVLAWILGPEPFGVVALALAYLALVQLVLEQGVAAAIIQRAELETDHLDSAFWLNLVVSLALAGLSVAAAPWLAAVNGTPTLSPVVMVLSLMLPVRGLTLVQEAKLKREMDFRSLAIRGNVAAVVGGGVGLSTALWGLGVWALVLQQLVTAVVALALLWRLSGWTPRLRVSRTHLGHLMGFSAPVFVTQLAVFTNRRADVLLLGVFLGPLAVGLYRLADRLVETVVQLSTRPVHLISLSHFSRFQDDGAALEESVRKVVRTTALISLPPLAGLALASDHLLALLGESWAPAAAAAPILCVMGAANSMSLFAGPLLQAVGRPGAQAWVAWVSAVVSTGLVIGALVWLRDAGVALQVTGVAIAKAATTALIVLPVKLAMAHRIGQFTVGAFARATAGPLWVTAGVLLGGLAGRLGAAEMGASPAAALALVTAGGVGAGLAAMAIAMPDIVERARGALARRSARRLHAAGS